MSMSVRTKAFALRFFQILDKLKEMNTIRTLALAVIIIGTASCTCSHRSQMVGAFDKSTKLTAEEDSLFNAVVLSQSDLQLKPLKVSRQVVAGTNYRYECVDNNRKKVEVIVYEPLPGQGDARILSIDGKEYTPQESL